MDITREKRRLRTRLKAALAELRDIDGKSRLVAEALFGSGLWAGADTVLAYMAMAEEVQTSRLVEAAISQGKAVAVPRMESGDIEFRTIADIGGPFVAHPYGVLEPDPSLPLLLPEALGERTLVLVPGLGFDAAGGRLGRGKGYYDRFLAKLGLGAAAVGICFDAQLLPEIPMDRSDVRVGYLCTETGLRRCGPRES